MASKIDQTSDTSLFPLCSDRACNDGSIEEDINLALLTQEVLKSSEVLANWYKNKIKYRRRWARILRFLMIFCAGTATLIPLLAEVVKSNNTPMISPGFSAVFLALSGVIFALEKYFGHANAWIRFVKAKLAIEAKVEQLKLAWLEVKLEQKLGVDINISEWLKVLKVHQIAVNDVVANETETWVKEFQVAMRDNSISKQDAKRALP